MKAEPRGLRERFVSHLADSGLLDLATRVRGALPPSLLSIFTFHRIASVEPDDPFDPDVVDATPLQFRRIVEKLARVGTPVSIAMLVRSLETGVLPRNPFMITFDDGYRSCVDIAMPILRELGVPATFFIPTAFPDQRMLFWWDKIAALLATTHRDRVTLRYPSRLRFETRGPRTRSLLTSIVKDTKGLELARFFSELAIALDVEWTATTEHGFAKELIASWAQIRTLVAAGMDVESHTHNHRVLETLDAPTLRDELVVSRSELARQLGRSSCALAYPVGRLPAEHVRRAVADAGYRIAFTNASGGNRVWAGPFRTGFPLDRLAIRRHATERTISDAMLYAQFALPAVAY